jgi:serine/threonine protein kinase/tetratricopeptide (TPR) repeat protein
MNEAPVAENLSLESLVAQLADDFREQQERGEHPAVEEYVQRYPQFEAVIRNLLASLELIRLSSQGSPVAVPLSAAEVPLAGCLGDFRLLREVGRGGMGVVYEAEQLSLGRRVALKVLPFASTLDARQLQRFKNEAQAAAHLHHTHIVPVHATGCERGVHFYAMQYIEGPSLAGIIAELRAQAQAEGSPEQPPAALSAAARALLTDSWIPPPPEGSEPWAMASRPALPPAPSATPAKASLSTERSRHGRLYFRMLAQLGVQAAEALEHAHQLGVVHRDIKPANLLLQGEPGVSSPGLHLWITDFGLAHCQGQAGLTMSGDLVGTLRYMSPEQALAQRVVIDHRTDIYSLGATLYELLTLEPAFGGRDRQELLRQIAFEEARPPRRLDKAIPAELETIILKMLEKSPADRYATAQEVADDLRRFLENRPIRARRPSVLARVRKWSWRHRGVVTAVVMSTIVALALSSLFILHQWRLARAREQEAVKSAAIATAIKDFLITDLLTAATPGEAQGHTVTAEEVLDKAAQKIDTAFPDQPEVEAAVRMAIGSAYNVLDLNAKAEPHVQRAVVLRQQVLGPEHPDTLDALEELGQTWIMQGQYAEGEQLHRQTLETARRVLGDDHSLTLDLENALGFVVMSQGKWDEAAALFRRCLQDQTRVLGEEHLDTLDTMNRLAFVLGERMGKWREGEPLARRCLELRERVLGENHPATLTARDILGACLMTEGKWKQAEAFNRETFITARRVWGPKHNGTLICEHDWALMLYWLDRLDEAEAYFQECVDVRSGVSSAKHPETLTSQLFLAYVQVARGKLEPAERQFHQLLALNRRIPGPTDVREALARAGLGFILQEQGRWVEAEDNLRQTVASLRRALPGHFLTPRMTSRLATLLDASGQHDEAGALFRDALDVWRKNFPPDHPELAFTLSDWAEHLMAEGDLQQAEPALTEALRIERAALPPEHRRIGQTLCALGWLYTRSGRPAQGKPLLREGLDICRRAFPAHQRLMDLPASGASTVGLLGAPTAQVALLALATWVPERHWMTADAESRLGGCLSAQARYAEAEPLLLASYQTLQRARGAPPRRRAEAWEQLVHLYEAWQKPEQVAAWRARPPAPPKSPATGAGARRER